MRVTIVAATGGIGRLVMEQALLTHEVTVVVRDPTKVSAPVRVVRADLTTASSQALETAMEGADLVLSCLGARTAADAKAGVAWRGTASVTRAMAAVGARRLVVISAAPVATTALPGEPPPPSDVGDDVFTRLLNPLVKRVFRHQYDDLARMEAALRESALDWTVVRPPRLLHGPPTTFRTALGHNVPGGRSVRRANVAKLMLELAHQPQTIHQVVGIAD